MSGWGLFRKSGRNTLGGIVGGGAGGARDGGGHGGEDGEDRALYWLARELSAWRLPLPPTMRIFNFF